MKTSNYFFKTNNRMTYKCLIISLFFIFALTSFQEPELKWDYDKKDWTPLMKAIYKWDTKTFTKLIKRNEKITYAVSIPNSEMTITALEVAIRRKNELAVKLLLDKKTYTDLDKYLIIACGGDNATILHLLFDFGANPNYINEKNGYTPIIMATAAGSNEVLVELLKNTQNINKQLKGSGCSALMCAARDLNVDKVKILLEYKADKELKDIKGKTAYDYINYHLNIMNKNELINKLKELLKKD